MRTALISDIHGNLTALRACLEDARTCRCDRVLCLGDLVDGGPGDAAGVREIMALGIRCVRGNHDESAAHPGSGFASLPAGSPERAFLASLPPGITEGDTLYTHITPRRVERKIRDRYEAWNALEESSQRLAFMGHTHIPLIFGLRGGAAGAAREVPFRYGRPLPLDPEDRYIICVGAVGYGRDGIAAPRYAVHDPGAGTLEFRMVDAPVLDL